MSSYTDDLLDAFGFADADPDLLAAHGLGAIGDSAQARRRRRRLRLANAVLREEIRRIDDQFEDLPWILLKGQPLEELLFDDRARLTGDIDMLVVPGDLEAAQRRLGELGYGPKRDEAPRMWFHNQQPWAHDRHGVVVELHWSTTPRGVPPLPIGELFESRRSFSFDDDLSVDILDERWLLLHLAVHFHHHMGFAKGLVDIAAWLDRFGGDVDEGRLLERARRTGHFGMLQWPLWTLAHLVGRQPPLLEEADAAVRAWARASARAMRGCVARGHATDLEASMAAIMPRVGTVAGVGLRAAAMLALDGWPDKVRAMAHAVAFGPHRVGGRLYEALR